MAILTVNVGSSNIRLAVFRHQREKLLRTADSMMRSGEKTATESLRGFLAAQGGDEIEIAAHRVVHGGSGLIKTSVIDGKVEREIDRVSPLAPLHNPPALEWIGACRDVLGKKTRQVAVFDTAFFASLPQVAQTYALPRDIREKHQIRRYGFHGIAHQAMWERWRRLRPKIKNGGKIITIQLGSGCSITAIDGGKPVDTSMGFSPVEGLVMATRSGDVDPGIIIHLQKSAGLSIDRMDRMLNKESGLLGVSGLSRDMRDLLASDSPEARLAVDLFCYRVRKYIGAYLASLGGADGILLGGGIAEHLPAVRERILSGMEWGGIRIDMAANRVVTGKEARISSPDSDVDLWVIPVDEAAVLAGEAAAFIK